jgi:hypothetical protein
MSKERLSFPQATEDLSLEEKSHLKGKRLVSHALIRIDEFRYSASSV